MIESANSPIWSTISAIQTLPSLISQYWTLEGYVQSGFRVLSKNNTSTICSHLTTNSWVSTFQGHNCCKRYKYCNLEGKVCTSSGESKQQWQGEKIIMCTNRLKWWMANKLTHQDTILESLRISCLGEEMISRMSLIKFMFLEMWRNWENLEIAFERFWRIWRR